MPIVGITDARAAFPRIGTLRKGEEKQGNKPGRDLDYFRFDSEDEDAIAKFHATYGDRPQAIEVLLPKAEADGNLFAYKEEWGASGLVRRCDGQTIVAERVGANLQRHFVQPKACLQQCGCKQVGRLSVIVPCLKRFAYVTVTTTSINDLVNISGQLTAIEQAFGRLDGIPMLLKRTKNRISVPKGDRRSSIESWLLSIEVSPDWASRQIEANQVAYLQQAEQPLLGSVRSPLALPETVRLPRQIVAAAPDLSYKESREWYEFTSGLHNSIRSADPPKDIDQWCETALNWIDQGVFPSNAKTAIAIERDKALDKYQESAKTGAVVAQSTEPPETVFTKFSAATDLVVAQVIQQERTPLSGETKVNRYAKDMQDRIDRRLLPSTFRDRVNALREKAIAQIRQSQVLDVEVTS